MVIGQFRILYHISNYDYFSKGAPFSPDYALVKWTDTSTTAIRSVKYLGFTAASRSPINYGTNCVLLNTQIGLGTNPFVQIQPQSVNLNQVQPQYSFGNLLSTAGRTPLNPSLAVAAPSSSNIQVLQPNSNPGIPQSVPAGAKPWLLDPKAAMELELVTEPQETIIEPVLRNQYLTKLKRLLPTFFDDFNDKDIESFLLGQQQMRPDFVLESNEEASEENQDYQYVA